MQIRVRHYGQDGEKTVVEVIDPSDGAVVHSGELVDGEQIVVTATSASSPADIEFGHVEHIPEPEAEAAESGEVEEEAAEPTGDEQDSGGQRTGEAEGAEAPADEDEQAA